MTPSLTIWNSHVWLSYNKWQSREKHNKFIRSQFYANVTYQIENPKTQYELSSIFMLEVDKVWTAL